MLKLAGLVVLAAAACVYAASLAGLIAYVPGCDSDDTKGLVYQILTTKLGVTGQPQLTNIRAQEGWFLSKRHECRAEITGSVETPMSWRSVFYTSENNTQNLVYVTARMEP